MLKRFIAYYRPHKGLFWLDMSASAVGALLSIIIPYLTRNLLKTYIPKQQTQMIFTALTVMLTIVLIKAFLTYIRLTWGHILGVRMESDMRRDLFSHIQKFSFNYFDNVKTGHIMSRISNDLNTIAEVAHHAPEDLIISLALIVGSFAVMFCVSAPLAGIAFIPVPLMAMWGIFYGGSMRKGFRKVRKRIADMNSTVENSVQGIREVKSFANEKAEIQKFEDINLTFKSAKEDMYTIMGTFFSGMTLLIESYFLVVISGGVWLIYRGSIDTSDLVAFILYVYFILNPIQRLVNFAEHYQLGTASFERFTEVMDICPDIVDSNDAVTYSPVAGKIDIENLSFKYETSAEMVLSDINMQIPARSTIAFVGPSGAGKSTLVSLLPRFYEALQGQILIDDHDIRNITQSFLRSNIGIVQQNVFLFDTTIGQNILYGNLQANNQQLIEAAAKANILDFIQSMPDGFDTLVGERGVKLSGGQKQRIAIARVFLKDPAVFIFDEATSSLDTQSESLIQRSLELLSKDRTTIIIAHRLSTIKFADYIYVFDNGTITEQGSHSELIAFNGLYKKLYSLNLF